MLFKTALFAGYISVFWPFDINVIGPFFQSISTEKKDLSDLFGSIIEEMDDD